MFKCSFNYCVLWGLWHILLCTERYNDVCFWCFNDNKTKNFCRSFSAIYNLYVAIHRSDLIEHIDFSEHVVVWYSIQLCIDNLGGNVLGVGDIVFTQESFAILAKILLVANEVVWVIVVDIHDTWFHCCQWGIIFKIWVNFSNYSSKIVLSFKLSNISPSLPPSLKCSFCVSTR